MSASRSASTLPPGPPTRRFVNMVRWLVTPLPWLDELAARYGNAFTMRMPRLDTPMVIFAEPDAVRELWTGDPLELHAGQANAVLRSVLGEHSLLLLDGERHLRERRLMLPPFHGDRMRAYGDAMRDAAAREIERWPIGRPFPVHRATQAITLEVIMRTIFGVGGDDARVAPLRDALVRWTALGTSRLGTALLLLVPPERALDVRQLARRPWGRFLPWAKIVHAQAETDRLMRELIAARRHEPTGGRDDILSMLLEARDDTGAAMTDDQLRDEMLTLLLAGHETTATTLAWTIHHLLEHPAWLDRVRAEVRELGDGSPLLDAAIKETLRLTPIVPMVGRMLAKPRTIGGFDLPAGAFALASIYLVHHRADLWPDPARFDPGRFVGKKIDPSTYFPFGGGARRCLGMAFASYEMKIVLATILARTELAAAAGARVKLVRRGITFAPSGGMPVVMTARR
ncbi:MAG TPA: cytochrome P450 [Kofleriaceae bacterium]|nr:cytochrome P450 [Kofleriaceae bacterium]